MPESAPVDSRGHVRGLSIFVNKEGGFQGIRRKPTHLRPGWQPDIGNKEQGS